MSSMRKNVLLEFKRLHRIAENVFHGDTNTLVAAKTKINEEFRKNKNVKNTDSIHELVNLAQEVGNELQSNVIQAEETKPGLYTLRITEHTTKLNNTEFNEGAILSAKPRNPKAKCGK